MSLWNRKKKVLKNSEQSSGDLWDTIKQTSIHIVGVSEGGEKEKGIEGIFEEIMAENSPHFVKCTNINIQEVKKTPSKIYSNPYQDTS